MTSLDNPFYPESYWSDEEEPMAIDEQLYLGITPPPCDPDDMNTWPLYHVFMKVRRAYWDPTANRGKGRVVYITENDAWYTRAPSPEGATLAPRILTEISGDTILATDYAYVPEESTNE